MAQDLGFGVGGRTDYRVYFLTDRRLYELGYTWLNTHDDGGQVQPRELWIPQFRGELQELSLRGADVMQMVQDVKANVASVVSVAPSTLQNDTDEETRVTVSDGELPASLVFILPSGNPSDTFRRTNGIQEQSTGGIARALSSTTGVNEQQHYDVIEVDRTWGTAIEASTNLTYKQAIEQTQALDGALIFRYYGETNVPQGKKRDTLEWLNPQYVPWQETLGFYFRGLFFETSNVIEVPGEQGDEQVPAEIYLATAFQVQRDGPRNISIYRPFGKHEEAIAWLRNTAHVKASITRLVPDPTSTNWFVLSDMQNLNPLGFRPQGEVEWL